ncbi:hypothetical protein [Microlunatus sp. Gsoil 973]|uniref:hypothetical protein n=1 Tax=Microlunatus sp. Gsoil 973 TaxID=2672569 RepID=UPI0012B481D8|nr:hypothetical protein [Microlunatus sp. Gsoil 973]QGN34440.1 hypothetical protein GJV80_18265 [Microlunatus sp. Gsoil 973]
MTRQAWVRPDNASNIFLGGRSPVEPKVFRISADLDHDVSPLLLQKALDETFGRYRLCHVVLRSGIFWCYLQDSDPRGFVAPEDQRTCAPIYGVDRRNLLFRVVHHRRRVSPEVFHAFSDGTGALWFLFDLVLAYRQLRYPAQVRAPGNIGGPTDSRMDPGRVHAHADIDARSGRKTTEPVHELGSDSFNHYFHRRRRAVPSAAEACCSRSATAANTVDARSAYIVYSG